VADALKDLRARSGRLSSALHLAGRPGKGYLVDKSSENFDAVYGPKAIGAVNLHEATLEDDLEEFVLFSSVSAVLPAQGQADYTAANLVLRTHTLPTPAYGVNIRMPFEIDRSTPVVFIFSWSTPDSAEYEPRMATAGTTVLPSVAVPTGCPS